MPPKQWNQPLHASPRSHRLFNNSSVFTSYFWLVVVCWFANWWPIKATMYLIFIIFCIAPFDAPQTMGHRPPTRSAPAAPPNIHPIYCSRQPLVGCCVLLLNNSHLRLRPRPRPSFYFSMCIVLVPQSADPAMARVHWMPRACYRLIGSSGTTIWIHGRCFHGE